MNTEMLIFHVVLVFGNNESREKKRKVKSKLDWNALLLSSNSFNKAT